MQQNFRITQRSNRVRGDLEPSLTAGSSHQEPLFLPNSQASVDSSSPVPTGPSLPGHRQSIADGPQPQLLFSEGESQSIPASDYSTGPRCSARSTKGKFSSTRYINEVFLAAVIPLNKLDDHDTVLCYQAELETDMETFESNVTDPRVYAAKYNKKPVDQDTPTFHQAMSGEDADKYIEAMKEEIANLQRMNTWELVDRTVQMKVLKGTRAFRLKCTPDGVA